MVCLNETGSPLSPGARPVPTDARTFRVDIEGVGAQRRQVVTQRIDTNVYSGKYADQRHDAKGNDHE